MKRLKTSKEQFIECSHIRLLILSHFILKTTWEKLLKVIELVSVGSQPVNTVRTRAACVLFSTESPAPGWKPGTQ